MTLAAPRSRQGRFTLALAILAATIAFAIGLLTWSDKASAADYSIDLAVVEVETEQLSLSPPQTEGAQAGNETSVLVESKIDGAARAEPTSTVLDRGSFVIYSTADYARSGLGHLSAVFLSVFIGLVLLGVFVRLRRGSVRVFDDDTDVRHRYTRSRQQGMRTGRVALNSLFAILTNWSRPHAERLA